MKLNDQEKAIIVQRRRAIRKLRIEYEERLTMYEEGLTHAGDVISRRAFLVNLGEAIPEIILSGYKCPKEAKGE